MKCDWLKAKGCNAIFVFNVIDGRYAIKKMIMKGVGMLVVSLRGVNFGFWSRLGCSGQNAIIFSRDDLV